MSRVLSGAAFAAAILAFTLPFGLVSSCDGGEVRFTGAELATFSVPADDAQDAELRDSLEHGAGLFAIAALVAAAFGLVLSILGRPGAGVSAAIGLVATQLVLYAIVAVADDGDLFVGYWLALISSVVAAAVCLIRDIRARRRSRRSLLPAIEYAVAVLLPPVGLVVASAIALIAILTRSARRGLHPRRSAA
jgi:hypothetical protein